MKIYKTALLTILALAVTQSSTSIADDSPRAGQKMAVTPNDPESSVTKAAGVYKNLIKEGKVPAAILSTTQCVAVFPSVITAALGVGGTHGDGVAFCKNTSTKGWSNPVFLNVNGGSVGLQAGAKSTDVVIYMTRKDARTIIENGDIALTGELSAVAGTFDQSFTAPESGMVAYGTQGGAFVGASVNGTVISHDKDEQKAFYGTYDPKSIFEGPIPLKVAKSVNELQAMLPY